MADAIPFGPLLRLPTLPALPALPTLPRLPALPGLAAPLAGALALGTPAKPEFMSAPVAQADGAPWRGGGAVARTTGRVFFTLNGADYSCSGSTVASANADVALTAAHCVNGGAGAWAANWTFVPGYHGGKAPYGAYTARDFYVDDHWTYDNENVSYDFAFVALNTAKVHGVTTHAVTAAGGQGIKFGPQPAQEDIFGYPAEPPFTGAQLDYCSGPTAPDPNGGDNDAGVDCGMTEGDSGGPWLAGVNPRTGTGTITSVSSFKYDTNNQALYGPELGSAAESLYNKAQRA
jgi:V8-like Glu-specific endopeptidase